MSDVDAILAAQTWDVRWDVTRAFLTERGAQALRDRGLVEARAGDELEALRPRMDELGITVGSFAFPLPLRPCPPREFGQR